MSNSLDNKFLPTSNKLCYSLVKKNQKPILKSRENIFKNKCNKELKKKLKKYKLRRDGIEDPDILDVSQILVRSLRIKSPNSQEKVCCNNNTIDSENQNPKNYLFKMVRRKKACIEIETFDCIKNNTLKNDQEALTIIDKEAHKQQMDAFKIMMDSRHKSIGSNSPGKEKTDEIETKESLQKREIKAKRMLSLQKMAQSKGALYNKEIEEYREKSINKKLLKRAEKFKDMLAQGDNKNEKKLKAKMSPNIQFQDSEDVNDKKHATIEMCSLKLCNIFTDDARLVDHAKAPQKVIAEDKEFLNKLSPSLKKKENMLCYFKKISKEDNSQHEQSEYENVVKCSEPLIKVKLQSKRKKKTKKKLLENLNENSLQVANDTVSNVTNQNGIERNKRKRDLKIEESCSQPKEIDNMTNINDNEKRPKRHAKKPIKYTEDVHVFSSDEELHIFTPKKKKVNEKYIMENKFDNQIVEKDIKHPKKISKVNIKKENINLFNKDQNNQSESEKKLSLNDTKSVKTLNIKSKSLKSKSNLSHKTVKLAPIFATKTQLSPIDIEAKQKFLNSGVPEKLKKKLQQQQLSGNSTNIDTFPVVVHIQQNKPHLSYCQEKDWYNISNIVEEFNDVESEILLKSFLNLDGKDELCMPIVRCKPEKILKSIKTAYPKFPVYRTYHLLRGKCQGELKDCGYPNLDNSIEIINGCIDLDNQNPDRLSWCDKYKPTSSKHIIGNFESVKELKRWLETWTDRRVKTKSNASDSSDFSDFYHSDTDSKDTVRNTNNVLILTGQTGTGKTSSVYAVASELAVKVIEVNASSKRTGKRVLQDLQEATQSHKVNRGKSSSESSQKLKDQTISHKKQGNSKKINKTNHNTKIKSLQNTQCVSSEISLTQTAASQEAVRTCMSLILIDDADIVFEEDDGFCSAISQLIHTSKRPVILSTSSLSCTHLQKFIQNGKILHMQPLLPSMLGTWLDIMCLADVGMCHVGLGAKLLDMYKGDMRRTINCLQFYMNSNKHMNQEDFSQVKYTDDDENSSNSWADSQSINAPNDMKVDLNVNESLQILQSSLALDMFDVWWSLSSNFSRNNKKIEHKSTCTNEDIKDINQVAQILDTMSIADYYDHKFSTVSPNLVTKPWLRSESASLLDNENFYYYRKNCLITKEISDVLMNISIVTTEKVFKYESNLEILPPSMSIKRNRDKVISRHSTLSSYLNPSAVLDRRATALDYWSSCRTICRIERNKTDTNSKRNNRFCHYLKSLNILCKNDYFDSLADSLT